MSKNKSNRAKLIGLIHMQKSAAGISTSEYQQVIYSQALKNSCSECTMPELIMIFQALNEYLKSIGKKPFFFKSNPPTMQDAVVARAQKLFGLDWEKRINGFIERFNKTSLSFCSLQELRQVMAFITTIENGKRGKK